MHTSLERLRERRQEEEGGFTLIELLIVIVILGILAAIVVFAVQNLTTQSAKASCGGDYKTVETAMETYKAQVGHYPANGAKNTAVPPAPSNAVAGDNYAASPGGANVSQALPGGGGNALDGVEMLYATQTGVDGTTVGSWLKDTPTNGSLYRVWVALTTTAGGATNGSADAILVQNLQTEKTPATPAAGTATVGIAGGTLTVDTSGNVTPTATAAGVNGTCLGAGLG